MKKLPLANARGSFGERRDTVSGNWNSIVVGGVYIRGFLRAGKHISYPGAAQNHLRVGWVCFELLPQIMDVRSQIIQIVSILRSPDRGKQLLM